MRLRTALLFTLLLAACNRGTSGGGVDLGGVADLGPACDACFGDAGTDAGTPDAGSHDAGPPGDAGPTPAVFHVEFTTTKGTFVVESTRAWAPNGVDRFYTLVTSGFYDECRFFRVIPGFVAQFGINGTPSVNSMWSSRTIPDDPVMMSNTPGTLTFAATPSPNSRTTQLFINYGNNTSLDSMGFAPIGTIISGMSVPPMFDSEYAERPDQSLISSMGNAYLDASFPNLDHIITARVVP